MNKKQHARHLFMAGNKTQKEIAEKVGLSERTVFTWIHQYNWDTLRNAAWHAPVTIADNLCAQIVELQNSISAREAGKRFPTPQEAETTRKLVNSLDKMKKYPSSSQSMQVLELFRSFVRPADKDFARKLGNYMEQFLEAQAENGFIPANVEYGADPLGPVSPFYEEVDDKDDEETHIPCANSYECRHPGDCSYPRCSFRAKPGTHPPHAHAKTAEEEYTEPAEIPATPQTPGTPQLPVNEQIRNENNATPASPDYGISGSNFAILKVMPLGSKSIFARPPLKAVVPPIPLSQIRKIQEQGNNESC